VPELLFYPETWLDREFKKAFRKLSAPDRESFETELGDLLEVLQNSRHPMTDPALQRWRPTAYKVRNQRFQAVEYRLRKLTRVIVGFLPPETGPIETLVLLTVTLKHDHPRMQRILEQHRGGIRDALGS
jgi:hypothetical protein